MRPLTFCSSMRSASTPASPDAPGRSSASVSRVSPWIGIQRTWTLRKNTMPVGPQVLERVREHVDVHERAPGTGPRRTCRARHTHGAGGTSSGPRPRRCRTVRTRRSSVSSPSAVGVNPLTPRRRLAHAGERAAVLAELVLERRQLGEAHRVEPVRIDAVEVDAHVEHREAVDLDGCGLRHAHDGAVPSNSANASASRHAIELRRVAGPRLSILSVS